MRRLIEALGKGWKMRIYALTLIVLVCGCSSISQIKRNSLVDRLEGTWDTLGDKFCNGSGYTHKIETNKDRSKVKFIFYKEGDHFVDEIKSIYEYNVIKELEDRIVMQIIGEERKTSTGLPVIWELIFEQG